MANDSEIILITGGSGFLGQHLVKLIQERDSNVKEIRIVDLVPYENRLQHIETKPIVSFIGDICKPEAIEKAFEGVDCVFHCAAFINFQYPPNITELERVNVNGTKAIVSQCIKHNIPRLVYTSTTAVNLVPYMGRAQFSLIVNQTEAKAATPTSENGFLIAGYASSKFRAEKIVLGANGSNLSNNTGELLTVALRSTVIYGEEDSHFFPTLVYFANKFNGHVPKIAGQGGKHQQTYAGNVAWAHIRAKDTLKTSPKSIAGLPIFITDDTPIEDVSRFCQRISRAVPNGCLNLQPTWWSLPTFFTYFLAFLLQLIIQCVNTIYNCIQLKYHPCTLVSYAASIMMFSRLRASIHLDYEPIFNEEKSIINSANWYEKWFSKRFVKEQKM